MIALPATLELTLEVESRSLVVGELGSELASGDFFYAVRFKGHLATGIRTGLSRESLLVRKRKDEAPFRVRAPEGEEARRLWRIYPAAFFAKSAEDFGKQLARLVCARAIERTEKARARLRGDPALLRELAEIPSVERLMRDYPTTNRRGKRWKICAFRAP